MLRNSLDNATIVSNKKFSQMKPNSFLFPKIWFIKKLSAVSVSVPSKNILILNARIDHGLSTFDKRSFSVFRHPIWWWHFPPNNLSLARSTTYFHIMQFWWKRQIGLQKYLLKKEFFFFTKICICVLFNSTSNFEIYFLSFVILSFVPEKKNISSCLCKMCVCVWVCV